MGYRQRSVRAAATCACALALLVASSFAAEVPPPIGEVAGAPLPLPLAPALAQLQDPAWVLEGPTRAFDAGNLWEYINGDAERYVDAGLKGMSTATFRFQGKGEAVVDVYRMAGPAAARLIFQSESTRDWAVVELGDEARYSAPTLVLRTGADFVRIVAYETTPETRPALLALGTAVVACLR